MGIEFQAGHWELNVETEDLNLCEASRAMFGLTLAEHDPLAKDEWRSRVHPEDLPGLLDDLKASTVSGEPYSHKFRVQLPDGSARQIIGVGAVVKGDGGRCCKIVGLNIEAEPRRIHKVQKGALNVELPNPAANENEVTGKIVQIALRRPVHRCSEHGTAVRRILQTRARAAWSIRRSRSQYFDPAMLGEPAFDLMLALYGSEPFGNALDFGQILGAGGSLNSTDRWLDYLQHNELVRCSESTDERSKLVQLTAQGIELMDRFLTTMGTELQPVINKG